MFRSEPLKDCQLKLFAAFVVTVSVSRLAAVDVAGAGA